MSAWKQIKEDLKQIFSADLRSLALLRIGVSLLVLVDLLQRSQDLVAFYTDDGIFPRSAMPEYMNAQGDSELTLAHTAIRMISLHELSGIWQAEAVLFVVAGIIAGLLLIGFHTKLMTFLSWYLLLSLQLRNVPVTFHADTVLRLLLFWGMFLPWGKRYSVDHAFDTREGHDTETVVSAGTVAYCCQVALIYWFAALWKRGPAWKGDGTAVASVLSIPWLTTLLGGLLLPFPVITRVATWATFVIEGLAPFLLFIPRFMPFFRLVALVIFGCFQIGLALSLEYLGFFPAVMIVATLGLIPSCVWDEIESTRLYRSFYAAVVRLSGRRGLQIWRIHTPIIHIPSTLSSHPPRVGEITALLLLAYIIFINLGTLQTIPVVQAEVTPPESLEVAGYLLGINQAWSMFCCPPFQSTWPIVSGRLRSGEYVDLMRKGQTVDWSEPQNATDLYKNYRWFKYIPRLAAAENAGMLPYAGSFFCRTWNDTHGGVQHAEELAIVWMRKTSDGIEQVPLWEQPCP